MSSHTADTPKTTPVQAFLHLLKGYLGPGCLSLPWAVTQLGLWQGGLACLIMGYWTSHNCWTVVELKRQMLEQTDEDTLSITYPAVAGWLFGPQMKRYTQFCVCVQQLAICTVFLSFCGVNLQAIAMEWWPDGPLTYHAVALTAVLPVATALALIPNLKSLAPFTAVATALLFVSFGMLAVILYQHHEYHRDEDVMESWTPRANLATLPLALCAILYSYEGICLVLPVEASMATPARFTRVFVAAMILSAGVYSLVGVTAVAWIGPVSSGSLTAFLLEQPDEQGNRWWLLTVNALVSVSVLLTYPLQLVPALELIEMPQPSTVVACCNKRRSALDEDDDNDTTPEDMATSHFVLVQDEEDAAVTREFHATPPNTPDQLKTDVDAETRTTNTGLDSARESDGLMFVNPPDTEQVAAISTNTTPPTAENSLNSKQLGTRLFLVFSTYAIAVCVPNVEVLISLAGAFAGSCTALILPPVLQIAASQQYEDRRAYGSYALVGLGVIFLIIGTIAALVDIVQIYAS